jgi:hypothetical protein
MPMAAKFRTLHPNLKPTETMRNKLFTASVDNMLFKQYSMGSDLDKQKVVTKIFNPYGEGRWYLLNSDPNDPDYIWAIVSMFGNVEMGSVSRSELESIRLRPFGLPLERDIYFTPKNAKEVYDGLLSGKFFEEGGEITPELHGKVLSRTHDIYEEMGGKTKDDFDIALDKAIIEFGYDPEQYHLTMQQIGAEFDIDIDDDKYAKGGGFNLDKHGTLYRGDEDSYAKGGKVKDWKKGSTTLFLTEKEAENRLNIMKNHNKSDTEYKDLRVEKLNDRFVVSFLFRDKYAKGGELFGAGRFAKGGNVGKNILLYKGQSLYLKTVPSPKYDKFLNVEIVAEQIKGNNIVKAFVRKTGEIVPFTIDPYKMAHAKVYEKTWGYYEDEPFEIRVLWVRKDAKTDKVIESGGEWYVVSAEDVEEAREIAENIFMQDEKYNSDYFKSYYEIEEALSRKEFELRQKDLDKKYAKGGGTNRPLYVIANEIRGDWKNVYFGAKPYLSAMSTLNDISDYYFMDSARDIVNYFLANATTWRGDNAKRIKAELKSMVN